MKETAAIIGISVPAAKARLQPLLGCRDSKARRIPFAGKESSDILSRRSQRRGRVGWIEDAHYAVHPPSAVPRVVRLSRWLLPRSQLIFR